MGFFILKLTSTNPFLIDRLSFCSFFKTSPFPFLCLLAEHNAPVDYFGVSEDSGLDGLCSEWGGHNKTLTYN